MAETTLPDGVWVSTVWLGYNHQFQPGGRPIIFETMVFTSRDRLNDLYCERYSTLEEAQAGHERIVARLLIGKILE